MREPGLRRVIGALESSLERITLDAVAEIWEQVPAYRASADPHLRDDLTTHVGLVFRALLTSVEEDRPVVPSDFPITAEQARERVRQGVSLPDFLQAFRIGQLTLWDGVSAAVRDDPHLRDAAMSLAGRVMHLIEVGSSVAAEAYLDAQRNEVAEHDRLRRDLFEDLLAGRDVPPGPKRSLLRTAGLEPGAHLIVASVFPVGPLPERQTLPEVAATLGGALAPPSPGLTVVRQQEVIGLAPVQADTSDAVVDRVRRAVSELGRGGVDLAVGVSTVRPGLAEVPEAYTEACVARRGLRGSPGLVPLSLMSVFDYLVLRDDVTALRLIRPELRRFVEEDLARDGALVETVLAYAAHDLRAKAMAEELHLHVNTAYYRLDRIAERSGCDLRGFADLLELVISIRLLSDHHRVARNTPSDHQRRTGGPGRDGR
ncbi:helix-turn-helix domain-containing protein [Nocardiopsis sp. N85]|uniref:PucR family transcriptional regulator n=1 Tax=Nocardiopsis sp. N85 TaxID=3029400 RepID=UPI00237F3D3C|nr:helix-turn-helix domain-containing protein [Nocardiopsis sp. N85]MDE3724158.1 helix-turn-helix domain-containing protein [Nocardiopsis sp. N85]